MLPRHGAAADGRAPPCPPVEAPQDSGQLDLAPDSDIEKDADADSENDPEKDCRARTLFAKRCKGGKPVAIAPAADAVKALKPQATGSVLARASKRAVEPEDAGTSSASKRTTGDGSEPLAGNSGAASSRRKAAAGSRGVVSTMADGRAERVQESVEAGACVAGCILRRHGARTCVTRCSTHIMARPHTFLSDLMRVHMRVSMCTG